MAKKQTSIQPQIIVKSPRREASDVGTWRQALKSADNERVVKLFDLYDDLLIDGVLSDAFDKRVSAITNSDISFQDADGQEVDTIKQLIDTPAFENLLTFIMKQRFYGRSGFEFDFTNGFKVEEIDARHINLKKKQILIKSSDLDGIPYEELPNVVVLGNEQDYGLFLKTAPFAIYKRGGFGDYAQWIELFGMPQRVGKYNAYDTESKRLLEEAMERAGSAPWLVIPKEADVETINNSGSSSNGTSYNDFRKACNEEMLIAIQGQTLTTIAGDKGARSLGEVHKEVSEEKKMSDMRFAQRVLNFTIKPILEARGFSVSGGSFIFPKQAEPLGVHELVQLSNILPIPQSYLYDKYSIPTPEEGEAIAGKTIDKPPIKKKEPQKTPDKTIEDIHITTPEAKGLLQRMWDFFVKAPALTGAVGSHLTLNNTDINDKVIGAIDGKKSFNIHLFEYFKNDFLEAILLNDEEKEVSNTAFAYNYESDAFKTAQELNIFHFSAGKTLAEIMELNRLYLESTSFEDFYKKAVKVTDVFNKSWQKVEYETATLIAESAENYQRLMKKLKLFPYWEYRTVGDAKVRPEHRSLHGIILPANDPLWKIIFPPNGWKCRCYIVPRMAHEVKNVNFEAMRKRVKDFFETTTWKKSKAQGFGVNRALLPELFTANQMYIKKFPAMAKKLLKDLNYRTYKLGTYKQNRDKAKEALELYKGTSADFFSKLESENEQVFFRDYNNRMILFDEEKYLKGHTPKKYKVRTQYLEAAQEALKKPDEVWIRVSNKFNNYHFIKYYNDVVVIVVAEMKEGKIYRIKTWFPIAEDRKLSVQYRQGLLIKKQP